MRKITAIVPTEIIEQKIYIIRGVKVMLSHDLAFLYQVETRVLIQAIKRNQERFPVDFMFQLNEKELNNWRSQIVTSNPGAKMGLRYQPYAFTEQGVAMLSAVLKSKRAVDMSIAIVRAFVKLRELLASHKDLVKEIEKIRREQKGQNQKIESIMNAINKLLAHQIEAKKKEPIGFRIRK